MAVFTPGVPVSTDDPVVAVEQLPPGTHRFRLEVVDDAGNHSAADEVTVVVRAAVPIIDSVRPSSGAWTDDVVVIGRGFDPAPQRNEVFFNGVHTPVADGTANELLVRVPEPATTGPVSVRNAAGEAASARPFIIPVASDIPLNGRPIDLAAEPGRGEIWVLHAVAGAAIGVVAMLDPRSRETLATVQAQGGAHEIAIGPPARGQAAAVSNSSANTVTVVDVESRRVREHVRVNQNPRGVAIRPDGGVAYVVCAGAEPTRPGFVFVIDLASLAVVARIEVGRAPERVVFSPDGKRAFVNDTGDGTVSMIDADAHRPIERIKVGGSDGSRPSEVAVAPETFPLLVANAGTHNASVIAANLQVKDVPIGFGVGAAAVSAAGKLGWLAGPGENVVMAVEMADAIARKQRSGGAGDGPKSIVTSIDARLVFVSNPDANSVSVYDAGSAALDAVVRVPQTPTRGVATRDGALVCYICAEANRLVAIEVISVQA